jgi:hypothetical protein
MKVSEILRIIQGDGWKLIATRAGDGSGQAQRRFGYWHSKLRSQTSWFEVRFYALRSRY